MYYLLDYENIGSLGLKGIDSLTDKDIVCIFYVYFIQKMLIRLIWKQ